MLAVLEMIEKENQMYINMGKKEGKKEGEKMLKQTCIEIAKKLLKRNTSTDEVAEITGLDKKEIEKIAKMQ